ncbi:GntR family transcriptional regulator [Anaerococcus sp. AGMB00486]|uniref:GntR family transcriptional regulator n=2 Tax=Anaerococcus TaxID=165779 RepID=A0ABX2NBH8_9FIRM|nr:MULTISPECIES: GntR family transcriptional regulator [Anaerococcus]MDY3005619.1 GntR family transcriptional regulator [Anaerococcus porci]MSS78163.1 GntR family transcriptional regulator [Anaerococcus porci]NVF12033.1 GntR family transcriptional regulator [Anaerococcus faecalis]
MNIIISNKIDKPIYEQIKDQIKALIIGGKLKEDAALPGMRSLASDLKVSLITTKRAYNDLEAEGFIYTVPAKGSFVKSLNKDFIYEDSLKKIEKSFEDAMNVAKSINLSKDDLIEILDNLYN